MTVGESDSGDSAGIFYPGLPELEDRLGLVDEVQHQVTELAQRRFEPWVRHELLRLLEERRQPPEPGGKPGPRDAPDQPHPVTQFDYLPVAVGFDTLLVRDELLITKESYYGGKGLEGAESYLGQLGLVPTGTGCGKLDETIFRLVPRPDHRGRMRGQQLADIAGNLQGRGYSASVTNVIPTMGTIKGQNGPQPAPPPPPVSMDMVRSQVAELRPVQVAVIDTGIWAERLNAVAPESEIDFLHEFPLGEPPAERREYLDLDAGHGTFVTGIVKQIAPYASVRVYRAIDGDGIGSEVTVACKIIEAVDEGAKIINLSLGCQTLGDYPPIALHRALTYAWERDVMVVAAAGNYADTRPCWPAAFRGVVSVAGLAPNLTPAQWASHGFWVTCSTIGQGLYSWFVDGKESPLLGATAPVAQFTGPDPWGVWSGSSFAAPQITGLLAQRYQASPGDSLRTVLRAILAEGRPLPGFGQAIRILPGI